MRRATKEESATCRAREESKQTSGHQEEQDSTWTETSHSSFWCKGLNPNSTWLKQEISLTEVNKLKYKWAEFQVWMNPGELTEGRVTSKAWGRFLSLSSLCLTHQASSLGTLPWVTVKWPSVAGSPHTIPPSSSRERRASLQLASGLTLTGVAWAFCLLGLITSSNRCRQPWAICHP